MKNSTIRLRDDEVDLSGYKIGEECEIEIKGIMKGQKEEQDYSDMPMPVSAEKKSPEPKKYIEYTVEVLKVKKDSPAKKDSFFDKNPNVGYGHTKRSGE